jgi:hypothetical protein
MNYITMPQQFTAQAVQTHNAARAYPLIQIMRSDVSLDAWLAFVAATNTDCGSTPIKPTSEWPLRGILSIENERGYIHGLFSYHVAFAIDHKSVLEVSNFVAVDTADRAGAIKALISAMEELARTLNCTAIHTQVTGDWADGEVSASGLSKHLQNAGHGPNSLNLCKPLH